MNAEQTVQVVRVFQLAYPHIEVTPDQFALWSNSFANDDINRVLPAARLWVDTEEYWPTIAGLRNKMRERAIAQERELSWTSRPEPYETYPTFEEGRAIAAAAYEGDCERRGVEANWEYWNKAMGLYGPAPQRSAR